MKKVLLFFIILGFFSYAFANDFQTPKLDLKVRKIAQYSAISGWRFEVTNNDSKPINTSYLEIRFWVYEPNKRLVGKFFNGVEWTNAYGIKSGQAVMCAFLSPTYDTIGNRKANYAIRYRDGEDHWLKPGETWKNIRFGYGGNDLNETTDYSQIPQEQKGRVSESLFFDTVYDDPHFCLYYKGSLVQEWLSTAKADPKTGVEPDPYRTVGRSVANPAQESASNDSINPMYSKLPELTQPLTTQDLNKVIMQNGQMINVAQAKMEIQAYSQAHPGQTVFARPMQGNPNIRYASLPSQPSNGVAFSYDADGNTLTDPSGRVFTYDSLDRMIHATGPSLDVSYVYDGDGLRVKKINNITGIQTSYLWDTKNITGVPQVLEELQNGLVVCVYTYGADGLISMDQLVNGSWVLHYFGKDGEGNVRTLEDQNGQVTDTFDYDAFGNLINQTGSTQNKMLYAGEYFDSDVQLYYLRNRWMSPSIGRFYSMDSNEGNPEDPLSLHKYLYTADNPINKRDPSGHDGVDDEEPIVYAVFPNIANFGSIYVNADTAIWPFPYLHTYLEMIPGDQDKFQKKYPGVFVNTDSRTKEKFGTIGAGPSSTIIAGLTDEQVLLISGINRYTDVNKVASIKEKLPIGNVDSSIGTLLQLNGNYKNELSYFAFPDAKSSGYNSNSYISGILKSGGLPEPSIISGIASDVPGFDKPVPPGEFQ